MENIDNTNKMLNNTQSSLKNMEYKTLYTWKDKTIKNEWTGPETHITQEEVLKFCDYLIDIQVTKNNKIDKWNTANIIENSSLLKYIPHKNPTLPTQILDQVWLKLKNPNQLIHIHFQDPKYDFYLTSEYQEWPIVTNLNLQKSFLPIKGIGIGTSINDLYQYNDPAYAQIKLTDLSVTLDTTQLGLYGTQAKDTNENFSIHKTPNFLANMQGFIGPGYSEIVHNSNDNYLYTYNPVNYKTTTDTYQDALYFGYLNAAPELLVDNFNDYVNADILTATTYFPYKIIINKEKQILTIENKGKSQEYPLNPYSRILLLTTYPKAVTDNNYIVKLPYHPGAIGQEIYDKDAYGFYVHKPYRSGTDIAFSAVFRCNRLKDKPLIKLDYESNIYELENGTYYGSNFLFYRDGTDIKAKQYNLTSTLAEVGSVPLDKQYLFHTLFTLNKRTWELPSISHMGKDTYSINGAKRFNFNIDNQYGDAFQFIIEAPQYYPTLVTTPTSEVENDGVVFNTEKFDTDSYQDLHMKEINKAGVIDIYWTQQLKIKSGTLPIRLSPFGPWQKLEPDNIQDYIQTYGPLITHYNDCKYYNKAFNAADQYVFCSLNYTLKRWNYKESDFWYQHQENNLGFALILLNESPSKNQILPPIYSTKKSPQNLFQYTAVIKNPNASIVTLYIDNERQTDLYPGETYEVIKDSPYNCSAYFFDQKYKSYTVYCSFPDDSMIKLNSPYWDQNGKIDYEHQEAGFTLTNPNAITVRVQGLMIDWFNTDYILKPQETQDIIWNFAYNEQDTLPIRLVANDPKDAKKFSPSDQVYLLNYGD